MTTPIDRRQFLTATAATVVAAACAPAGPASSASPPRPAAASRGLSQVFTGMPTTDGAGVSLTRVIGQPALRNLDPFLMLDRFHSDDPNAYIRGFPDHPHRGFETVTVMLHGRMRHRDSRGNSGLILGGGSQWMTAGRGIVHSEMPEQDDGLMSGFQLWINLPAAQKMRAPEYQDLQPAALTALDFGHGVSGRLIAGSIDNQRGPVRERVTDPLLTTLALPPRTEVELSVAREQRAFAFVHEGDVTLAGSTSTLRKHELGIFDDNGARITLRAGEQGAGILLAAATPIGEPIVQYGPFVMNTEEEIRQAFADYRAGTLAL